MGPVTAEVIPSDDTEDGYRVKYTVTGHVLTYPTYGDPYPLPQTWIGDIWFPSRKAAKSYGDASVRSYNESHERGGP